MRSSAYMAFFAALILLQLGFWWRSSDVLPDLSIVPDVPGEQALRVLAFGDSQFLFRVLALRIQNCGDTFGRFTALYKYDYNKLSHWFSLLDGLDNRSDFVPALASYYFSQTQRTSDVNYIVNYLYAHAAARVEKKWWWLVQAVYLANHKLQDKELALRVAEPLKHAHDIPVWAQQMPAFIHEQRGEMEEALAIMESIRENVEELTPGELNFMRYFIEERLHKLENMQDSPATR